MDFKAGTFLSNAVAALIIVAGIASIVYFIVAPAASQTIRNTAVDGCLTNAMVSTNNTDGSSWSGPNRDWFDLCMQSKGY